MALISKAVIVCTILYPWRSLLYQPWTGYHREVGPHIYKIQASRNASDCMCYFVLVICYFWNDVIVIILNMPS